MTSPTPGERDPARFNSAIRQLYKGGSNNTGTVTLRASQTTTTVNHQSCNPTSHVSIMPLTVSALAAMTSVGVSVPLVVVAKVPKIITLTRVLSVASGSVAYTGVGFRPSLVAFLAGPNGSSVGYASVGNDDGVAPSSLAVLGGGSASVFQTGFSIVAGDIASGANFQRALISSMDADGFTLSWTKTGTPTATATVTATCHPPAVTVTDSVAVTTDGVRVSSRTTGSFVLTHPSNAAVDQTFTYSITGGA